jgi:hypothetical protein
MSILKKIFRKTTKTKSENISPEMQLKIEQSRISYNLAVSTQEDLIEQFEINDLRIACSVDEQITMAIEGVVKNGKTKQEIENYLLKSGVDKVFNNLKIEN